MTKNSTFDGRPHLSEGDENAQRKELGNSTSTRTHKINKRPSSSALHKTVRGLESYIKVAKKKTELLTEGTKSLANALESATHAKKELKQDLAQRKRTLADQDALLEELVDYVLS
ncbi:hypothetical protein ACFE04_031304 [Oxalis oulophora]